MGPPMSSVTSSEESPLLVDSGDSAPSSVAADSCDGSGAAQTLTKWPSTFERSIGLLASPIIAAADANEFTKSPRPGGISLATAARRREQEKYYQTTPESKRNHLESNRLSNSERNLIAKEGMQRIQSLDFQANRADILQLQAKRRKEAQEYRQQVLQKQQPKRAVKSQSQPDGKSSVTQSAFNLANILMGVGLLGLPFCLKVAGFYGGIFCIVVFGLITCRTAILIGRQLNGDPRRSQTFPDSPYTSPLLPGSSSSARMLPPMTSFPEIARTAFGETGCFVLSVILYFELFSCISIFFVSIGDHLHQLLESIPASTHMIIVAALSMIPTIILRTPALLSYLSMVGSIATAAVVLAVIISAVSWDNSASSTAYTSLDANGLPLAFGLVAYCFSGHAIVPSIYTSMEKPQEFEKMVIMTFGIVVACSIAVGSAGYYMFGDTVDDQITLSLESHSKAVTAMKALTWLIAMTAFSKITLTMFPLALGFEEMIAPYMETERTVQWASGLIKFILTLAALLVSIYIPSFSYLCSLVGMICTMAVSVVFPAAAHLQMFGSKLTMAEKAINFVFVISGLAMAVVGTIVSV